MRLLLVEDEAKLGQAIKKGLEQDRYAVDLVTTAEDAQAYAETEEYDAMVFDRMLPGGKDSLDVATKLRSEGIHTPILFLTALGETTDKVRGLDAGGDDYLVKPFQFEELLARIRALTRRPTVTQTPKLTIGDIIIDTTAKTVHRGTDELRLSRKEFALLEYLARQPGQIFNKQQLIDHVWDFDSTILPNTVEVFIRTLRQKIDQPDRDSVIETVRGFGYRLRIEQ